MNLKTKIVIGPRNSEALVKIRRYMEYHGIEYHLGTLKNDKKIYFSGNKKHIVIDYDDKFEGFKELTDDFGGELRKYIKSINLLPFPGEKSLNLTEEEEVN